MKLRLDLPALLSTALAAGTLAACSYSPATPLIRTYSAENDISNILVCHDYGCAVKSRVALSEAEWDEVRQSFIPAAADAREEREQMRNAVATVERLVGPKAGTENDGPGAPILSSNKRGQLDCIDEAYNTTSYLLLMQEDGLINWHTVGEPERRGYILNRWPHNTATVIEHGSSATYALDSWFGANGELPDVVPIDLWLDGWTPEEPIVEANAS